MFGAEAPGLLGWAAALSRYAMFGGWYSRLRGPTTGGSTGRDRFRITHQES